eukprot:3423617-Prorocentrum_lima.AAC.1
MTSSLVGSEMCIRDSAYPARLVVALQKSWSRLGVQGKQASGARELGFDAVSYTHLTLPTICSV